MALRILTERTSIMYHSWKKMGFLNRQYKRIVVLLVELSTVRLPYSEVREEFQDISPICVITDYRCYTQNIPMDCFNITNMVNITLKIGCVGDFDTPQCSTLWCKDDAMCLSKRQYNASHQDKEGTQFALMRPFMLPINLVCHL